MRALSSFILIYKQAHVGVADAQAPLSALMKLLKSNVVGLLREIC